MVLSEGELTKSIGVISASVGLLWSVSVVLLVFMIIVADPVRANQKKAGDFPGQRSNVAPQENENLSLTRGKRKSGCGLWLLWSYEIW